MASRTIYQVLEETTARYGDAPALRQPVTRNAKREYLTYSWNDYKKAVDEVAAGLRSLGVGKGEIVCIDSETRLELYVADIGTMANGSISAALYPSYPAKDLVRTIRTCKAKVLFAEDPQTLESLREAPVEHRVLLTGAGEGAMTLEQLRAMGRDAIARDPALLSRIKNEVTPEDAAVLYQTSGATGEPKMALAAHAAIVANLDMGPHVLPIGPEDETVAFLPSAHIAQRVVIELLPLRWGTPVTFSKSLMKLPQEIRTVRPTFLLAPPRLWERIYSTICTEIRKRPAVVRKGFYGGLALAHAAQCYRREGKPVPVRISGPLRMADLIFFRKVRSRFGGRLGIAASGAAPLSKDLAEFYEAIGMPLIEGYGLTEGGVVAFNPIDRPKPGSIGKALPGIEVRIADDGELLVKSPCLFQGYFGDPIATAEVLQNGWLHTGDIAHIDSDGYVFITGRKKELIVSSTGKKIYPARVEGLFKTEALISQVVLLGDRLPYLMALFTINTPAAQTLDGMEEWKGRALSDIASAAPVATEIRRIVGRVNKQLAPFEQVRKYRVLGRDFTIEEGELTATMKVRRTRVLENFREHVDELYAAKEVI